MDFGDDCTVGYKVGFPPCWFHPWIFKKSHKKRQAGSHSYETLLADYHISKGILIGFSLWRDTMKSSFLWILFDSCINLEKRPVSKSFQFTTFEKAHSFFYFFWCSTTMDSSFSFFWLPFPPPSVQCERTVLVRNVGDRASKLLCKTTEPFRPHGGSQWWRANGKWWEGDVNHPHHDGSCLNPGICVVGTWVLGLFNRSFLHQIAAPPASTCRMAS